MLPFMACFPRLLSKENLLEYAIIWKEVKEKGGKAEKAEGAEKEKEAKEVEGAEDVKDA